MIPTSGAKYDLSGWGEIATHLKVTIRTAQSWEKERGLPVCRTPGSLRATIFASSYELDAWVRSGFSGGRQITRRGVTVRLPIPVIAKLRRLVIVSRFKARQTLQSIIEEAIEQFLARVPAEETGDDGTPLPANRADELGR